MPGLISLLRHVVSRGHPEIPGIPFTGFRLYGRNDKSLRDDVKLSSPAPPRAGSGRGRRGVSTMPERDTDDEKRLWMFNHCTAPATRTFSRLNDCFLAFFNH